MKMKKEKEPSSLRYFPFLLGSSTQSISKLKTRVSSSVKSFWPNSLNLNLLGSIARGIKPRR